MKPSPLLAAPVLLLFALCGCERQSALITAQEAIAFRIVATMSSDQETLETANRTTERFVTLDDKVIAEWVPIRDNVSLDVKSIGNAVTRQTQMHTELLVLHSANDVSNTEILSVKGFTDSASREQTLVTLTDVGSQMLLSLTAEHVGKPVAVIANGELRAIPKIVTPVRNEMVLSPDRIDKARLDPYAAN